MADTVNNGPIHKQQSQSTSETVKIGSLFSGNADTNPPPGATSGGTGPSFNPQSFTYTFTGAEVGFGTDTVTVPLPAVRPNTNYIADPSDAGKVNGAMTQYNALPEGYGLASLVLKCGTIPAIGDKVSFFIWDKTS